jgi:prepilin-type N-terminal cleavage/methylation domain-containing protein
MSLSVRHPSSSAFFRPNNRSPITDNPARHSEPHAFTLIELLVVISIIAILIGLLFPAFKGVQDQAKKTQAKNDLAQIITAVNAYYTEYGTYPLNSANNGGGSDTCYGDPNGTYSSADLFNVLRALPDNNYNKNNQLNSKQVVFFNAPNAKDPAQPRAGFFNGPSNITNSAGNTIKPGSYLDPWGSEYTVFVDGDYDNEITTALGWFYPSEYPAGGTVHVRLGVGACSLGKDGKWGDNGNHIFSKSDDVGSWQ